MSKVAALLAAALALVASGCGGGGAEPGAPEGEATLVLDFSPNAVHAGIYLAAERGLYREAGVVLAVREPSASTDAPKLLQAGRADLAILDIHDLGLARERGLDVVGVAPIVQRPLAAVIAAQGTEVRSPADLAGATVGVTGLPSDRAVLDAVLEAGGVRPEQVERVTIGFKAVAALSAGRLDAATAFWNAEGVALRRLGVPTREMRVDEYGAPRYPELVLAAPRGTLQRDPELIDAVAEATAAGYEALLGSPEAGLGALLSANPGLDRAAQRAQLRALLDARALSPPGRFDPAALRGWSRWAAEHGILRRPIPPGEAFRLR